MTPQQKQALSKEYAGGLTETLARSEALLANLRVNYDLLRQAGKLGEVSSDLDQVIEAFDEVFQKMSAIRDLLGENEIQEDYPTLKANIESLIEEHSLNYTGAFLDNEEAETLLKSISENQQPPAPVVTLHSVHIIGDKVNLNSYPPHCFSYGAYPKQVSKLGDAHACVPKILYFALKTGMARFIPGENETPEAMYLFIIKACEIFANAAELRQKMQDKDSIQSLSELLFLLKQKINQIEFHPDTIMLLMGDIFMDRNGNDLITALFLKRIFECKSRSIILISNHDAKFIFWMHYHMPRIEFIKACGQSSETFQLLVQMKMTSPEEILKILDECYFNSLVGFYYEIAPNDKITNISTHAPNGEWEMYEMVQGLSEYALLPKYHDLFTENQKSRLSVVSSLKYDEEKGLTSNELRSILDLMNEIFHTNAIKPNKKQLIDLIHLGFDKLTEMQCGGFGIPPRVAPFFRVTWNRDSPRSAPPKGEPRFYLNGHQAVDMFSDAENWVHSNLCLDDLSGKTALAMNGQYACYALPVPGYSPMPEITAPVTSTAAPVALSRALGRPGTPMPSSSRERDRSPPPSPRNK